MVVVGEFVGVMRFVVQIMGLFWGNGEVGGWKEMVNHYWSLYFFFDTPRAVRQLCA